MPRLSLEPLDPHVRGGPASTAGITAAAAAVLATTTGDALFAAVLVGLAAADALAGAVAVAGVLGALARFGTTSLSGLAGAQAVLGPAAAVSPVMGAAGSALAAVACVLIAPARDWRAVPLGLLAGVLALGPSATDAADAAVRLAGAAVGVALALYAPRVPRARVVAPVLAAAGLALAVAA